MNDSDMSSPLLMRWLPVTDEAGRTCMEAVWVENPRLAAPITHAA